MPEVITKLIDVLRIMNDFQKPFLAKRISLTIFNIVIKAKQSF